MVTKTDSSISLSERDVFSAKGGPPPALVLGSGVTALGVVRCLGRLGVRALCLSGGGDIEARSRWYERVDKNLPPLGDVSVLANLLESIPVDRAVLIGCTDHWAIGIGQLPDALSERFLSFAPDADVVLQFIDKRRFGELIERLDIPRPVTVRVRDEPHLRQTAAELSADVFLKPADSQRFHQRFGLKAFRTTTRDALLSRYQDAHEAGLDMFLQEYIPGPPTSHHFIDGFVDDSGDILAVFARQRGRMHPPDFGNSSYMVSEEIGRVSDAVNSLERIFRSVAYRGIFSAEFKHDPRDGRFKILEINCRPWWYVEFASVCGVDVISMTYRRALGLPVAPIREYKTGVGLVYPYYDYLALRRMRKEGEISLFRAVRSWLGARQPLFAWDDPMPALVDGWARIRSRFSPKRVRGSRKV